MDGDQGLLQLLMNAGVVGSLCHSSEADLTTSPAFEDLLNIGQRKRKTAFGPVVCKRANAPEPSSNGLLMAARTAAQTACIQKHPQTLPAWLALQQFSCSMRRMLFRSTALLLAITGLTAYSTPQANSTDSKSDTESPAPNPESITKLKAVVFNDALPYSSKNGEQWEGLAH